MLTPVSFVFFISFLLACDRSSLGKHVMSEDQLLSPPVLLPPASVIECDIDYEAHFARAWDVSEAIWVAEELERRQRAAATATCDGPRASDATTDPPATTAPSPAPSYIFSDNLSSSSPPSPTSAAIDEPIPHHDDPSPHPDQPAFTTSECPPDSSSRASYFDGSELSECDSVPIEGSRKRRRRDGWSAEKLARERERNKAKKAKRKAAGNLPPRKKSDAQKARKKEKRAEEMARRLSDGEYDGPTPAGYRLPKNALRTWGIPIEVPVDYEMENASAADGAYVGINRPVDRRWGTDDYTLEGEMRKGRTVLKWDGVYVVFLSFLSSPCDIPLSPSYTTPYFTIFHDCSAHCSKNPLARPIL